MTATASEQVGSLQQQLADAMRRAETINRLGRLITSSLSLDDILQTAVNALNADLQYPNVDLLLVDPDASEWLVSRARGGLYARRPIPRYRQSIHVGIVGAAARTRQRILVNDVERDPRYIRGSDRRDSCSEFAVPLIVGDELLGVLNIETTRPIRESDAEGVAVVADQLAVAIVNARLFASSQRALQDAELLSRTSQRISIAVQIGDVIVAYLDQVAAGGRYACTIALYDIGSDGQRTAVVVMGTWSSATGLVQHEQRLPYTRDALDPLLDAGQTLVFADVRTDPRVSPVLRDIQERDGRPALALIPLIAHGQRIGLIVLSDAVVREWLPAELHQYQATAALLAATIESRRQQQLLFEHGQQLAVVKERDRLARDLHDSVTQLLFSITLIAQSITPAWQRSAAEGEQRVQRLLDLSQAALLEMRALLVELHPADANKPGGETDEQLGGVKAVRKQRLEREGFIATLRSYIALIDDHGLRVEVDVGGYHEQAADQEEVLLYITQEALNNVVKHARASRVEIRIHVGSDATRLWISDDGIGFILRPSDRWDGEQGLRLGLLAMRERAAAFGGSMVVMTIPGGGTSIEVVLPRMWRNGDE